MTDIWLYYAAATVGLLLVIYRVVRNVKWLFVRWPLWGVAAGLLVTPFSIGAGYNDMAPAIIMFALEGLFEGQFARAGIPLAVGAAVGLLLGFAIAFIIKRVQMIHASDSAPTQ